MEETKDIKIGDTVTLNSGGNTMTVTKLCDDGSVTVACWGAASSLGFGPSQPELTRFSFRPECLTVIDSPTQTKKEK